MNTAFLLSSLLIIKLVHAQGFENPGYAPDQDSNPHVAETALIEKLPRKEQMGHFLKFQAAERKVFFDDLSREIVDYKNLWKQKEDEILARQRELRKEFEPENHTVEERRAFYVKQREEMQAFKRERADTHKKLMDDHAKRRSEFHKRQKQDRKVMTQKLRSK
jgi:hypothetical protein